MSRSTTTPTAEATVAQAAEAIYPRRRTGRADEGEVWGRGCGRVVWCGGMGGGMGEVVLPPHKVL